MTGLVGTVAGGGEEGSGGRVPGSDWVHSAVLSHDGARLLSRGGTRVASVDGTRLVLGAGWTIRMWDAAKGTLIRIFEAHVRSVSSVVFSPDGARILSGGHDKTAKL